VFALDYRRLVALVAIEVATCAAPLLDDLNAECPAVLDVEFLTDPGRDVSLIPRDFALGVNGFTGHGRDYEPTRDTL